MKRKCGRINRAEPSSDIALRLMLREYAIRFRACNGGENSPRCDNEYGSETTEKKTNTIKSQADFNGGHFN